MQDKTLGRNPRLCRASLGANSWWIAQGKILGQIPGGLCRTKDKIMQDKTLGQTRVD